MLQRNKKPFPSQQHRGCQHSAAPHAWGVPAPRTACQARAAWLCQTHCIRTLTGNKRRRDGGAEPRSRAASGHTCIQTPVPQVRPETLALHQLVWFLGDFPKAGTLPPKQGSGPAQQNAAGTPLGRSLVAFGPVPAPGRGWQRDPQHLHPPRPVWGAHTAFARSGAGPVSRVLPRAED